MAGAAFQGILQVSDPGGPVPVSGPLTDAELRASPVPVTVDNAAGAAAVNIQDGGNSLTVDSPQLPAALVSGRLDENIGAWLGSTAPTVGSKTSANSIPVVFASDQAALPLSANAATSTKQSDGSQLTQIYDIAGGTFQRIVSQPAGTDGAVTWSNAGIAKSSTPTGGGGDQVTSGVYSRTWSNMLGTRAFVSVANIDPYVGIELQFNLLSPLGGPSALIPLPSRRLNTGVVSMSTGVLTNDTATFEIEWPLPSAGSLNIKALAFGSGSLSYIIYYDLGVASIAMQQLQAISGTVDTELPAAVALADAASSTPTTPTIGVIPLLRNTSTVDRQRAIVNALDSNGIGIAAAGIVGQLDEGLVSPVSENQFAPIRITSARGLHTNLRNNAGAEMFSTTNSSQLSGSIPVLGSRRLAVVTSGNGFLFNLNDTIAMTLEKAYSTARILIGNNWTGSISIYGTLFFNSAPVPLWIVPDGGLLSIASETSTPIFSLNITIAQHLAFANGSDHVTYTTSVAGFGGITVKANADFVGAASANVIMEASDSGFILAQPLPGGSNTIGAVLGTKTNNNAAPVADNFGVLPAIANVAAPVYAEGQQVLLSCDLAGNIRIIGTINASSFARANASNPTYVEATDNPFSQDLEGNLRTRIAAEVSAGDSYIPGAIQPLSLTSDGSLRVVNVPYTEVDFFSQFNPFGDFDNFGKPLSSPFESAFPLGRG